MTTTAILITGFASERSLAAAIIHRVLAGGSAVVLSVAGPREAKRAQKFLAALIDKSGALDVITCDLTNREQRRALAQTCSERGWLLTGVVHAVGRAALRDDTGAPRPLLAADEADLQETLAISTWSLPLLLQDLQSVLSDDASVVTLTYHGARQAVPGYNAMGVAKAALEACVRYLALELGRRGIRVNAVSAGSVRTPAAQAVPGFAARLAAAAERSPLGRTVTAGEVAATVTFLLSPAASGITAQTITCDCGVASVG